MPQSATAHTASALAVRHTAGPWKFCGQFADTVIVGPGGEPVLSLGDDGGCGDPDCCGGPNYHVEVTTADGRLMAGAPALYDVVRALVHVAQHGPLDPNPLDENSPLMDAARTALAQVAP